MQTTFYPAEARGQVDYGWFRARYAFSFGEYHDPNRMGYGALRVLNDSVIQPGKGFPPHPHADMEVITLQLQGQLNHTDVSGKRVIAAHDVQAITAGRGVVHSDLNTGEGEARQFQIWILPDQRGLIPVSHLAHFQPSDWQGSWKVLVSPHSQPESELRIRQQAWISRAEITAGAVLSYPLHHPGHGVFLMVIEGSLQCGQHTLGRRDALALNGTDDFSLQAITPLDVLALEVPLTIAGGQ